MRARARGTCRQFLLECEIHSCTHENVMPKYVALPCPSQPIVAHNALALDDITRVHHNPEQVEIEHIVPELPEEERPR